ncbi:DUF4367 domain-containing protein [Hominiventricola filiformis]|uniref:DUF4367 domain-containing protein n=1 Tax=Hominiventricola filiformis TaxID=2885352 RepID=A0AAE3AAU6_9FIRM|nr:DUF4367 domain-containing protein [Hominiventricola filiformis]MCC2126581.1 DUF4367 domain-containing protein [Hominiventricola filiformis]
MRQDSDEWLEEKIDEDLMAWADAEERRIMEDEELQNVTMPEEKLEDIRREIRRRRRKTSLFGKTRRRMLIAVAAVMVLLLGMGIVGSTKKLYIPVIMQKERGDEVNTKVENSESTAIDIDEDEVCQEIQDKLGVLPVKFKYRPEGMKLTDYQLIENMDEAILEYSIGMTLFHVCIDKRDRETIENFQMDGELLSNIWIESCGTDVPIYIVEGSENGSYCIVDFEYLNTYYSISSDIDNEEFQKIIENILIKNE